MRLMKILSVVLVCWFFAIAVSAATFTVDHTGDGPDTNPGNGICSTSAGNCTLRAAIIEANNSAGPDTIEFSIAGPGVHTITPATAYPEITGRITIDGWSQGNTGYNGPPLIEIDGSNLGFNTDGLHVSASNSLIMGLNIHSVAYGALISLTDVGSNTVIGCFLGTDPTGTTLLPGLRGGGISLASPNNTIGGTLPHERNIISGNREGIRVYGTAATGNAIIGNYIGTDVTGEFELGNNDFGVEFSDGASGNRVGGTNIDAANVIAFNDVGGVVVFDADTRGNRVLGNSIHSNGSLGIDLTAASDMLGVTLNDPTDADTGPNNFQNFPRLTSAINESGSTTIDGTLHLASGTNYRLEFFSNTTCNGSGYGEGRNFLGSLAVSGSGETAFTFTPANQVPFGQFVTATATNSVTDDTSEFSACAQIIRPGTLIVTNTNDSGPGSLRKAIDDANLIVGIDRITFDIPGPGVHTIDLLSPLPAIVDPVIVDGASQAGFSGVPLIELNGAGVGTGGDGFQLTGGQSTIRSLIINRFLGDGIEITSFENTVVGCYIGTDASGTIDLGNNGNGLYLENASSNRIGGATLADRNVISGNNANGLLLVNKGTSSNAVVGNYIGTDVTGTQALGNHGNGVYLDDGDMNVIGGATAAAGNLISANGDNGIELVWAFRNVIKGNKIGTDATGLADLGNAFSGISLLVEAYENTIGDTTGGNTIAFNTDGVQVSPGSSGNSIRGNSIFSNSDLGIDLLPGGTTANDPMDADTGANELQNYPLITNAIATGDGGRIEGTLNSAANDYFNIDLYASAGCDSSGNGEGRIFLGSVVTRTNIDGDATFSFTTPFPLPVGSVVTATATTTISAFSLLRSTSEFSPCASVVEGPGDLTFELTNYVVAENAGVATVTVRRNGGANGDITVDYSTSDGTATQPGDYTTTAGTLNFLNGETSKTFDVPIINDTTDEIDETINLTLSNPTPGVFLTPNPTAILTVTDNDLPPTISINDPSVIEGNEGTKQLFFTIQLSTPSSFPVTIDFATANGTATATQDYVAATGQVTVNAGSDSKNFAVTINGDLTVELDETVFINLSNPVNATITDGLGVGTITDDDNPGRFSFSLAPYAGVENSSPTITVVRSNGSAGTAAVDYATGGGSATSFTDYKPASGTLVFLDGETSKTFTVDLHADTQTEPTEAFNISLSNPVGGATLGVPASAQVNILDNNSGTLLTIGGTIRLADNSPVENVAVTLEGSATGSVVTNNLGQFTFPNLAPNGSYTVTPASIGHTFTPISRTYANLSADVTSANFTATPAPSRQLRIVGGNAAPGQDVTVDVELVAQGDENSLGFTLNYDPAILMNPVAVPGADATGAFLTLNTLQSGKLGVVLGMPTGTSFPSGTRRILTVTFNTLPTAAYSSPVTFGDVPVVRQIVNTNADPLPTTYLDGAVTFSQGYESDVAPRPTGSGNGSVSVADFTQVGRFVAGLDTLNPSFNEFQRADSAPRVSLGNGVLTVSDYTQAGRYAAGVDPVALAGGQPFASLLAATPTKSVAAPTGVRIVNATGAVSSQVVVAVETDAQGGENGFGFSVDYDPAKLANPVVAVGDGATGATLIQNTLQPGKVGVVLAMPIGVGMTAGTKQLVTIRFDVRAGATTGESPLVLADSPVAREISDADANVLPATFQNGTVTILTPTAASVVVAGRVISNEGRGVQNATVFMMDSAGNTRSVRTNSFGRYRFEDVAVGQSVMIGVVSNRGNFHPRLVTINDAVGDLDFVEEP